MRKDAGYLEYAHEHKCASWVILTLCTLISFKIHKFLHCRFLGLSKFYIPFENPVEIHKWFNILTTLDVILSLMPIILIDVYGITKYSWGDQYYISLIETLVFSLTMILIQIFEYRAHKLYKPLEDDFSVLDEMRL